MVGVDLSALTEKEHHVMAPNIPWLLFCRLIDHSITEIELQRLDEWKLASTLNSSIYNEILDDEIIQQALLARKWENNSLEWKKLLVKIKQPKKKISITYSTFYWVISSAALLLLLIGISAAFLFYNNNQKTSDGYTYIYSPRGQRTKVILPDQTRVWLNSESSLRYPASYNQKTREVFLEGEAFFEVKRNPKRPFFVQTPDLKVKAYGTSFNVKAFPEDNYVETTLIDGQLSVTATESNKTKGEIFLKPKEKLIFERFSDKKITELNKSKTPITKDTLSPAQKKNPQEPKISVVQETNPAKETLWKEGKLIFNNETFGELAVKLERWYDVRIHFEHENIRNFRFSGVFDRETINQAMEALKVSSQHTYSYNMVYRDIYLKLNAKQEKER